MTKWLAFFKMGATFCADLRKFSVSEATKGHKKEVANAVVA
jgi:hypothetical protein